MVGANWAQCYLYLHCWKLGINLMIRLKETLVLAILYIFVIRLKQTHGCNCYVYCCWVERDPQNSIICKDLKQIHLRIERHPFEDMKQIHLRIETDPLYVNCLGLKQINILFRVETDPL